MQTRDELLRYLEANKGVYLSGADIARAMNVSRNAVWKAVKALQGLGYAIDALPNRGYRLSLHNDILSPQGVEKYLETQCAGLSVAVFDQVASTNTLAREKAASGQKEGYVVMANAQTAGRGRLGRSFFSPPGTGVYISLLLRPKNFSASQAVGITTMAAVAMCRAIEDVSRQTASIKWVNDIFLNNKKVCGILTEASFSLESGLLEYAVLGAGLNVYPPDGGFPEELEAIAGSVYTTPVSDAKNRLAAAFLNAFMAIYTGSEGGDYVEAYRQRSLATGRQVTVISPTGSRSALVLGVDDECRLLVRYEDGAEAVLSTGEISIRL